MGPRIQAFDWAATPLGPAHAWPSCLKTSVSLMLRSPVPMALLWGPEGLLLYNDGYVSIAGGRHPAILGMPASEAWPEPEASVFNTRVVQAGQRGEPVMVRDYSFVLHRYGEPEQLWFDLLYNPVFDEHGRPMGMMALVIDITARMQEELRRQRVEQQLSMAQERLQLALNAGAVLGTWVWEVPQDVFTADARFARTFSIDAQALIEGLPLSQVVQSIHPEDVARIEALVAETIRRGGPYRAEYRVRQLDGSWLWIEANGHCELDAAGHPLRFPGVLLDIHQRKLEQQRRDFLLALSDRLRPLAQPLEIISTTASMLSQHLAVHQVSYAEIEHTASIAASLQSRFPLEAFGQQGVDALRQGHTVVYPELPPGLPEAGADQPLTRARAAVGVPLVREQQLRAVLLLAHHEPRQWAPGDVRLAEEVAARIWETMERARAEASLRELNATLERQIAERTQERNRLWEISQAPFLIADSAGRWLSVSPAWTQLLGWTKEELLGRTSEWMEHPEDRQRTRSEVFRLADGDTTLRFENRFRHRDGTYRWFSWVAVPADGLLYCVARDVTAEHERQEELGRIQEQLRHSQKMEAVGQLTGGIAHDFNNMLAGIIGSLALLARRLDGAELERVQRYIDTATNSANRAAALTHRLLAFARRQSLDVKPTDINALVHSLEELLHRTLGQGIALETVLDPSVWPALTDANQFESALLNLAINARDAMPTGGKLTVETANTHLDEAYTRAFDGLAPGDYVALSVSDTGQGMTPDVQARAFEPFFTTKPIGQGTGLGLSMIYGFVKQSGGHVRLYSEVGRGTTVRLYLPRHQLPAQEAAAAQPSERPRGLGETVLLVEDDAAVRLVVVEVLEDLGYQVLEAESATQALPHLESQKRIDLLVTDVGLPGMNGRQLAEVARERRRGLKVLFVTGYAEGATVRSGFLDEGMEMISKPFTIDALAARLHALLRSE